MKLMRVWSPRLGEWTSDEDRASEALGYVLYSEATDDAAAAQGMAETGGTASSAWSAGGSEDPWGLGGPIPGP
jgi:hypothetical protein